MSRQLLIDRAPVNLVSTKGKTEVYGNLPHNLASPLRVDDKFIPIIIGMGSERRLPLIRPMQVYSKEDEEKDIRKFCPDLFGADFSFNTFGLWSGYRSCLVAGDDKELYKLKGVAFGADPKFDKKHYQIHGGQLKINAQWEREYSDKFNIALREQDIEPAIECVGMYEYPFSFKRKKAVGSIMRTKGDTRLDELLFVLEIGLGLAKKNERFIDSEARRYSELLGKLGYEIGQACGKMKKLMDKSNLCWSDTPHGNTNAHIGNILVYEKNNNLAVGLVDFDASSDLNELDKTELKERQESENKTLLKSTASLGISYRQFFDLSEETCKCMNKFMKTSIKQDVEVYIARAYFRKGFSEGYEAYDKLGPLAFFKKADFFRNANLIDGGILNELFLMLPRDLRRIIRESRGLMDYLKDYATFDYGKSKDYLENNISSDHNKKFYKKYSDDYSLNYKTDLENILDKRDIYSKFINK